MTMFQVLHGEVIVMGDERDTKPDEINDKIQEMSIRINEIDALVRGMIEEMLDLKAIVMKMLKDQRNTPIIREIPKKSDALGTTDNPDITEKGKEKVLPLPDPPIPTPPVRQEKIFLKMQPDGTLKPEQDYGEDIIVASAYSSGKESKKKGRISPGDDSNLIIAEDE